MVLALLESGLEPSGVLTFKGTGLGRRDRDEDLGLDTARGRGRVPRERQEEGADAVVLPLLTRERGLGPPDRQVEVVDETILSMSATLCLISGFPVFNIALRER